MLLLALSWWVHILILEQIKLNFAKASTQTRQAKQTGEDKSYFLLVFHLFCTSRAKLYTKDEIYTALCHRQFFAYFRAIDVPSVCLVQ